MTALPDINAFGRSGLGYSQSPSSRDVISVDETFWGYIVKGSSRVPSRVLIITGLAWLMAVGFTVAALGLWIIPATVFAGIALTTKSSASILMVCMAAILLRYASRGTQAEMQVDTVLGEVREVVRNSAGRSTLIGRYGFDAIETVYLDRGIVNSRLMMAPRNRSNPIQVVAGATRDLDRLCNRLGRDIIITNSVDASREALPMPKPRCIA